jgi:hypothetical protein
MSCSQRLTLVIVSVWFTAIGCSVPWQSSPVTPGDRPAAVASVATSAPSVEPATALVTNSQASGDATGDELADVLENLQQIREIDPAAEQQLIARLRESPARSWPLVAEQFRTSLAYREQIASRQQATSLATSPVGRDGDFHLATAGISSEQGMPGDGDRLSSPFDALTDPPNTDVDSASMEAVARATPSSLPNTMAAVGFGVPSNEPFARAPLAIDGHPYPLATANPQFGASATPGSTESNVQAGYTALHQETTSGGAWLRPIESAANELSQNIPASPATTAEVHQLVTLRMLHLLSGNTEQALEAIPHLSSTEQDYWSRQLFALATYLDHHAQPDDKRRAAAAALHLDEAVSSLRELGALSLRNFSFCKDVYGYGAIQPYEADQFSPGEQVSLYVEVENYHSRSTEKGYCTLLGSTYEILNDSGERVGGGAMPDVDDCCRSRRRDFHIQYGITLPRTLTPGKYHLDLIVKDRQSDKIGRATVAFEIAGSGT